MGPHLLCLVPWEVEGLAREIGGGEQILEGHCLLASVSLGLNSPSPKLSML